MLPVILALYYSYTFDFQPQGRYYLPMVIPFMYFLTIGMEKLITLITWIINKLSSVVIRIMPNIKNNAALLSAKKQTLCNGIEKWVPAFLFHLLYAFLTLCLLYATFISMLGYYKG